MQSSKKESLIHLPSNIVDYLAKLKVVEQFDVIDSLLPEFIALLIAKHV